MALFMLVGVTGPSGAGKSTVVRAFENRGFCVVDADLTAREVVMPGEPVLCELAEHFGADIITPDGTLNRRLLANRAFSSRKSTDCMNKIMHGTICRRMLDKSEECAKQGIHCVFDAPLLFEAGLEKYCDCVVSVIAPLEFRIERLAKRDGLTDEEIKNRIKMQHEDEYYTSRSQYIVVNDKSRDELKKASDSVVNEIVERYIKKGES